MNSSVEMRFSRGIFLTPPLLGYDNDDGNLVINEDEAKTVRLIFFTYLYGYSCKEIAELLTALKRPTKRGNTNWNANSVLGVLQNERHCGAVLSRKTFTPNFLDHKSRKNRGERNQYRQAGHHEPIISPDDFIAVQRLISNAKYGNKGFLPELHVISNGALKGFVRIHPRWASFRAKDYEDASGSVYALDRNASAEVSFAAKEGDPDFRGFEVARSQFFETLSRISVTFSSSHLKFSAACMSKLTSSENVELLIHPFRKLMAVRLCSGDSRHKVQWSRMRNGTRIPKVISGKAFLNAFYEIMQWNPEFKYRISGIRRTKGDKAILVFNLSEPEVYMPDQSFFTDSGSHPVVPAAPNTVLAYPTPWANTFGTEYYSHEHEE
ncbi:MAG: recombinase family protein, partial [Mailhella sp.]|nr:recombinase family protein [Mailhella sp.]